MELEHLGYMYPRKDEQAVRLRQSEKSLIAFHSINEEHKIDLKRELFHLLRLWFLG
jgi:hypothetical protein